MAKKYDIFNLPPRLFKYYAYDGKLNQKRLSGEVYLACPFDFNDPCDCQREVINNTNERVAIKGQDWLVQKMQELEFNIDESKEIATSLQTDDTNLKKVHNRMLERLGILCLTGTQSDTLMWGYYASNEGICIEYDSNKIVRNIVIGFVNKMSYTTTRHLYEMDKYYKFPEQRTPALQASILAKAKDIIKQADVKRVTNRFLEEQDNELNVLNFLRNVFLKRIYAQSIIYSISPDGSPSPLFFNRGDKNSETKYFKKTRTWQHEEEFRFILSLGGRTAINIGKDCIKNIYLGCNMSNDRIAAITYLMAKNKLTAGIYKMKRLKNCGLAPKGIEWNSYKSHLEAFELDLSSNFSD